jgi:hypothetical protein
MKTSWIHLGRSPLPKALRKKWAAEFKGILRQNNGKNIKMIFCTQITLK